jgi:hypothetical protein
MKNALCAAPAHCGLANMAPAKKARHAADRKALTAGCSIWCNYFINFDRSHTKPLYGAQRQSFQSKNSTAPLI